MPAIYSENLRNRVQRVFTAFDIFRVTGNRAQEPDNLMKLDVVRCASELHAITQAIKRFLNRRPPVTGQERRTLYNAIASVVLEMIRQIVLRRGDAAARVLPNPGLVNREDITRDLYLNMIGINRPPRRHFAIKLLATLLADPSPPVQQQLRAIIQLCQMQRDCPSYVAALRTL